jgi:flagellar assembly protein FliH
VGVPQKFLFDTCFDPPAAPRVAPPKPVEPVPPPEPTYTRAELEAVRAAGVAEGRAAAMVEAAQSAETSAAVTLAAIARDVAALIEARGALAGEMQRDAVAVLRAVLQKTVPALCRKHPLAEVEALVADCLRDSLAEPRIVLRVGDAAFDAVQRRLADIAASAGYPGKLVLLADAALGPGDCRVEWADGGAERDLPRLLRDIDAALVRALDAPSTSLPEETTHD